MVVADYSKTGDAMMAALEVAMGIKESKAKMSQIFPLFSPMPRCRVDTKFTSKEYMLNAFELPEFSEVVKQAEKEIDGKGKILIRKSGTEPKIQVWVWSDDVALATALSQKISKVFENTKGFETYKNV